MSSLISMVKNKVVTFQFYKEGNLWYKTECGFAFPVPISDTGTASMLASDKAILFMRWISAEVVVVEGYEKARLESEKELEDVFDNIDNSDGC